MIMWVAPLQIKPMILAGIDAQIARAQAGEPSGLFFKTNSITDKDVIERSWWRPRRRACP